MGEEPTSIFAEWKHNIDRIIEHKRLEGESKRCPKCKQLSLTYDVEQGAIVCTRCGYKEYLIR